MINEFRKMKNFLLEEKELSPKQKAIAKLDPPADKIDAGDFKALRAGKKIEEDENQIHWPKEIPSRHANEFLFIYDESKPGFYNVQDVATGKIVGRVGFNTPENAIQFAQDKVKPKGGTQSTQFESEDHEVSMANNSIETIIKAAMELKAKLGNDEKDIPAWIQDHISKAENYITQASQNYHEYGDHEAEDIPVDGALDQDDIEVSSLQDLMEKILKTKK